MTACAVGVYVRMHVCVRIDVLTRVCVCVCQVGFTAVACAVRVSPPQGSFGVRQHHVRPLHCQGKHLCFAHTTSGECVWWW